ncbi:hypothetical protein ACQR1W_19750 [Bradyrhizobium sp. HKCCYLS1011]|uniref:hypothetical protein n=1 Tax=Bradyrhizobium sp. HKCCYLS1011 TaxID=3420733 RepID=UPI003EBD421C
MSTPAGPDARPASAILEWLTGFATWLLARSLNMPEPLVAATGSLVFAHVQAFETRAVKTLRARRLSRRLQSWLR